MPRLAEHIEDWSFRIKRDGWRIALPAIVQDLINLPFRHMFYLIVARSLLDPIPDLPPTAKFEIRRFQPSDIDLVREMDRPSEARLCARRLALGHIGFLALYRDKPAGHAWASTEMDPILERVHLKLIPGDFVCVDAYTAPEFRGQGLQTALMLTRFRFFHSIGFRRAVTYIEKRNKPSLAVWTKVGCRVIGHVKLIRIGPWRWRRYSYNRDARIVAASSSKSDYWV